MSGQLMLSILALRGHFFKLASKLGLRNGNHFAKCRPTFGTIPTSSVFGGALRNRLDLLIYWNEGERYE